MLIIFRLPGKEAISMLNKIEYFWTFLTGCKELNMFQHVQKCSIYRALLSIELDWTFLNSFELNWIFFKYVQGVWHQICHCCQLSWSKSKIESRLRFEFRTYLQYLPTFLSRNPSPIKLQNLQADFCVI
jgi:hypothetical protein